MKKLLILILLIFSLPITVSAQKKGANVFKVIQVAETVRDTYVVPVGETWICDNLTAGELQYNRNGTGWFPLVGAASGTPSFATLTGVPSDNASLNTALNAKQDAATAYDGSDALKLSGANQTVDKRVDFTNSNGIYSNAFRTFSNGGGLGTTINTGEGYIVRSSDDANEISFRNNNGSTNDGEIYFEPLGGDRLEYDFINNYWKIGNFRITTTADGGSGSGNAWSDPVDSNIIPDTTVSRELGSPSNLFLNGYFSSLNSQEITSSSISSVTAIEYDPRANAPSGLNAQGGSYFDTDGRLYLHDGVALRGVAYQDELGGGGGFSLQAFQDVIYENQLPNDTYVQFIKRVTNAEYDALSNDDAFGLNGVSYYRYPATPSGYSITNVIDTDFSNISFDVTGAEIDAGIDWSVTDGFTTLDGFLRPVTNTTTSFSGLDWSTLADGTHTLTVSIINGGARGANVTATVEKGSASSDLFPTGNAASAGAGEANSTNGWVQNVFATVSSISNPEDPTGGSHTIDISHSQSGWNQGSYNLSGLNSVPHTATFRTRRLSGDGSTFNWQNVTNVTYNADYDANGTNWFTATVTFTPTGTGTPQMRFYSGLNGGSASGQLQVSEITIAED